MRMFIKELTRDCRRAFIKELTRDFRRTFIKDLLGYINILLDKYRCTQDEILKRQREF